MNEICVPLDDELHRYLNFLEQLKIVKSREEAVLAALRIFKKLNMQDWLPYVYRAGPERVLLVEQGLLHDIFNSLTETQLYEVARISALKRKILKPFDPALDLTEPKNWGVILNELQNFGWGKFTRDGEEVMAEFLGVPIVFLKGLLETLFEVELAIHITRMKDLYVLKKVGDKAEVWR